MGFCTVISLVRDCSRVASAMVVTTQLLENRIAGAIEVGFIDEIGNFVEYQTGLLELTMSRTVIPISPFKD